MNVADIRNKRLMRLQTQSSEGANYIYWIIATGVQHII